MPALPAVNKVIKLEFFQKYTAGTPVLNTMHASYTGAGGSDADLLAVAEGMYDSFAGHFTSIQNSALSLLECKAIDLTSDSAPVQTYSETQAGGAGDEPLPASVALAISWGIARRYRGGHPRMYMAGMEQDNLADTNHWAAGSVTTWQAAAAAFLVDVAAAGVGVYSVMAPVCVSYFTAHALRVTPVVSPITGSTVHTRTDSQRRRTGKETT